MTIGVMISIDEAMVVIQVGGATRMAVQVVLAECPHVVTERAVMTMACNQMQG
jgi:hypothetical protein